MSVLQQKSSNSGRAGVSPNGNRRGSGLWPIIYTTLLVSLLVTVPLLAQSQRSDDAGVTWLQGFEAHRTVGVWVSSGAVTEEGTVIPVEGVSAVLVTLRDQGYAVGTGQAILEAGDQIEGTDSVDLAQLLARATRLALGRARARLEHHAARLKEEGRQVGEMNADASLVGLQVDLQVALELETIPMRAYDPGGSLFRAWVPGYHVLRAEAASGEVEWNWPGTSLALDLSVDGQLGRMLKTLGRGIGRYDAAQLMGLTLSRARVLHVVPQHRGGGRSELERGHRIYPLGALSERTVTELEERLAKQLLHRFKTVHGGVLMGEYLPAGNRYEGDASTRDAALAALSLARWAGTDVYRQRLAISTLDVVQEQARNLIEKPDAERDPEAEALLLLVMLEWEDPRIRLELRDSLISRLESLLPELQDRDNRVELVTLCALYHAGQRLGRQDLLASLSTPAVLAIERALEQPGLSRLPWAAELLAAVQDRGSLIRLRNRLDSFVDELQRLQRVDAIAGGPDDVMGAIRLASQTTDAAEAPDWTTAYAWRFVSELARAADVPDTRIDRQVFASLAARFVAHLSMTETGAYYCPYPEGAVGGVRASLLSQRMPIRATAESLLAVVRYQDWLARIRDAEAQKQEQE